MGGARYLDDFRPLFESEAEHPYILDKVKQISFYTDCLGKANWFEPSVAIDEELAKMLTQIAKLFAKDTEVKVKEIELWVKHMGRVKDSDLIDQKEALLHWYAEMQELGLAPKGQNLADIMRWLGLHVDE